MERLKLGLNELTTKEVKDLTELLIGVNNQNKSIRIVRDFGQPSCMHCEPDLIGYVIEKYDSIPRRSLLPKNTPVELTIRNAMREVEEVGAHVKLTDAITHLQKAFDAVADYQDEILALQNK